MLNLPIKLESPPVQLIDTAFGCPRDFAGRQFVYTVVSSRARGMSIGLNLNPDKFCNFDCLYCEVNRTACREQVPLDIGAMTAELESTLEQVLSGRIRERPIYEAMPAHLLELKHVALSGDGEPTLCPLFAEVVQAVIHLRARRQFPFFKLVLITNATGLHLPNVAGALELFSPRDEIWAKLDGGTQEYLDRVNRCDRPIDSILANIHELGRQRPVTIQSLFPAIDGQGPSNNEIDHYAQRLLELKNGGAQIDLVQVYSASRPTANPSCRHLPLRALSEIARKVREVTGLKAEVF